MYKGVLRAIVHNKICVFDGLPRFTEHRTYRQRHNSSFEKSSAHSRGGSVSRILLSTGLAFSPLARDLTVFFFTFAAQIMDCLSAKLVGERKKLLKAGEFSPAYG